MHWLKWTKAKEQGQVYCPMLKVWVKTYKVEGAPAHNSYTRPFVKEDGRVYFHKYNHEADCWHDELFYLGEHVDGIECTYQL